MKRIVSYGLMLIAAHNAAIAQVDTTFIYNNSTPYGSLDIRISKSDSWYYYLQEEKTFSFRESAPGVKTDTYLDMTSWDSSPYLQGNLREKNGSADQFVMNYRLLPPEGYDTTYPEGYPLLLIFHGLGESGNCSEFECHHADRTYSPLANSPAAPVDSLHPLLNNDHQLTNGGNVHLKARNDADGKLPNDPALPERAFPGFVLFPQNLNGWNVATAQDAIRIVRLLTKKYNIDQNRIYVHGLSNGGHGVFEAVKRAPWMFAAVLTMSAIDDGFINQQNVASTIAHIPLWMFQGALDENPYPQKTENYIKKFRDAGAVVRYTKYDNLGHGTWNTAYSEPDFFSWILGKNKADIHLFSGATSICDASGLKLELPSGFLAYEWQLNDQTISGATEATYTATTTGTYRARFSRVANPTAEQWNRWSDPVTVTVGSDPPQAQIKQHGTVLLSDLNNNPNAHLEAAGDFAHYYWYKDSILLNLPGDQDDTVKNVFITPEMGSGVYTLVTSDFNNCESPVSAGKHVFLNNEAPVTIAAPTDFDGTVNDSHIALRWTDASNNENGFEIWRRRKLDDANYSSWEMATLTASDITAFEEARLFPSSTYQYKIRAVSNTGRSEYTPATGALELASAPDTEAPAAPENLAAVATGVKRIRLTWSRSTDNIGIENYYVYYGADSVATSAADTMLILNNLPLNTAYTFRVKARDLAGNLSAFSNEAQGNTYTSGLYYEHSTGVTFDLDSIDWANPEFTGIVETFTLSPKTQEEYFNFRFDGYLSIQKEGTYQFRTGSDDGSRLKLNDVTLVDNDGVHDFAIVSSTDQTLATGAHRITVDFFDYIENDSLLVQYKGPDTNEEWALMHPEVLKSSDTLVTDIIPDNGPEDSFFVSIYPNPSAPDNINVRLQTVMRDRVLIQLLDPIGRILATSEVEPGQLVDGIRMSPAAVLAPGIYIVSVSQGGTTVRQRVIVKK